MTTTLRGGRSGSHSPFLAATVFMGSGLIATRCPGMTAVPFERMGN